MYLNLERQKELKFSNPSEEELKNCPFCGGRAILESWGEKGILNTMKCHKCGISTPFYSSKEALIAFWNTRQ